MLAKPKDYDTAKSYDSDIARLPVGGYVCEIKKMEETTARTGTKMITVYFDIADGDYIGYYADQYKRDKAYEITSGREAKWRGKYNIFPYTRDGLTNPSFKGFLTCVEGSNNGYTVQWPLNFDLLKGKKVGLLFREEDSVFDGKKITSVRPCAARTVQCILEEDFTVPKRRDLTPDQESMLSGGGTSSAGSAVQEFIPVTIAEDDELPF